MTTKAAAVAPADCVVTQTPAIDDEFRQLIPSPSPQESAELERSLLAEGCRVTLKVWESDDGPVILDGHNRLLICLARGIPYELERVACADRLVAKTWILRRLFEQRNLTSFRRIELALQLKDQIAARAKDNQRVGGTRSKGDGGVARQRPDKPIDTKRELGRLAGVSHDTVHKAEVVIRRAPADLLEQVRVGDVSVHAAYLQVKRTSPLDSECDDAGSVEKEMTNAS